MLRFLGGNVSGRAELARDCSTGCLLALIMRLPPWGLNKVESARNGNQVKRQATESSGNRDGIVIASTT